MFFNNLCAANLFVKRSGFHSMNLSLKLTHISIYSSYFSRPVKSSLPPVLSPLLDRNQPVKAIMTRPI